ncbi:hypothetical protein [Acidovorax sp. SDU_ACID1]|uniref:hypothetical protein n=1 Tax=Acidovorax sp. SDU_ACID1 TaxID=3136632 RepID=UPI0038737F5C
MASTSVRGTRFAVQLQGDGRTLAAVTEGTVAVDQRQAARAAGTSSAQVRGGQGVAVSADGTVGAPQALLPAPDLSALPASVHDADFLSLALTPVAGAVAYQVQVARDADLTEVLRSGAFPTPALRLRAVEDGHYHIAVRAVDATGLPGLPARRAITVKAHPVPPLYQAPAAGGTLRARKARWHAPPSWAWRATASRWRRTKTSQPPCSTPPRRTAARRWPRSRPAATTGARRASASCPAARRTRARTPCPRRSRSPTTPQR